mgnify:CR=1 FL=1|jgi:3-oxoacyl-[acyl-carrier-protein] synthase-3
MGTRYSAFRSIGAYVPEKTLTNQDFEKMLDTSDEWITKRTGIKKRHIAADDEVTSDLGAKAGQIALDRANLTIDDIDMIIVATFTGDYLYMPSTACMVAQKLGANNIPAFDVLAACTGFIYALSTARAYIESGMANNVLIVGAEVISRFVDYSDRTTCVLFGDGAGAAVISATTDKSEAITDTHISADGNFKEFLMIPAGGSANPISKLILEEKEHFVKMKGNETFKVAVRTLSNDVKELVEKNSVNIEEIKFFVPHQANYRIIKAVGDSIGLRQDQVVLTVGDYGNTSAASIPMAINTIFESGELQKGDLMVLDAFGGGLTWGSALLPFAGSAS